MVHAHLICHTHWDREWYRTRMQFRTKLVRLVDGLLELVENAPEYVSFMFDGQTIALEDYLEIKPYNRGRLTAAIQSGKILIGPWYILPDEMLVSGEAHLRNYLTGAAVAAQFGEKLNLGYLPDSFGHPEQMPQILRGLGFDATVYWRGSPAELDKTEFYWQAPDGQSSVLCVNMPNGYATGAHLVDGGPETVRRLEAMMDTLAAKSSTDVVLLMNGSDHLAAEKNIPEIIAAFNKATTGRKITFSNMPAFLADVKAKLPPDLKTFSGNLCYGDKTMVLGGTLSTRLYLKQRNDTVQKKMERYLEPLISAERLAGRSFDFAGYQSRLWKLILENHAHDSICGCSVDALHDEMMTRFACLEELEDQLLDDTCERLQEANAAPSCDAEVMLFEPTTDGLPAYTEMTVEFDRLQKQVLDYSISTTRELPGTLPPVPESVSVTDEAGRAIPCTLLDAQPNTYIMHDTDDDQPQVFHANQVRLALLLPGFTPGLHSLRFTKGGAPQAGATPPPSAENEFYTLAFDRASATFTVTDKETGRVHTGVHKFVDRGDAGDEYSYSWPDQDTVYTLLPENVQSVELESAGELSTSLRVQGVLMLPQSLAPGRKARAEALVACPVTVTARVCRGVRQLDFETVIDNQAKDHRLQVEYPTGVLCTESSGSAAFSVTRHPIEKPIPPTWEEYPQFTALTHGFADAGDGGYGLSLGTHGLTEYEAVNQDGQTRLRLTLLRCVGWISRPDLNSRKTHAGWLVETPGGQCIGQAVSRSTLVYHRGSWREAASHAQIDRALHPAWLGQTWAPLAKLGNPLAFLAQLPPLLRLSACKPAENGGGIVLRLYSLADEAQTVRLTFPPAVRSVARVDLAERPLEALALDETHTATVSAGKRQILSLLLQA